MSYEPPRNQGETLGTGTSQSIAGIPIRGIYRTRTTGGEQAPTKRTEEGYTYTTRVAAEPRRIVVEASITRTALAELQSIRHQGEPFRVAIKGLTLTQCKLVDLKEVEEGQTPNIIDVSITIEEIQRAQTGTTTLRVRGTTGKKSPPANPDTSDSSEQNPHIAQSEDAQSAEEPQEGEDSGFFGGLLDNFLEGFGEGFGGGDSNDNQNNG